MRVGPNLGFCGNQPLQGRIGVNAAISDIGAKPLDREDVHVAAIDTVEADLHEIVQEESWVGQSRQISAFCK